MTWFNITTEKISADSWCIIFCSQTHRKYCFRQMRVKTFMDMGKSWNLLTPLITDIVPCISWHLIISLYLLKLSMFLNWSTYLLWYIYGSDRILYFSILPSCDINLTKNPGYKLTYSSKLTTVNAPMCVYEYYWFHSCYLFCIVSCTLIMYG